MGGFTPLSLSYHQQSTVLIEAAVEAHVNPSAPWMDSRRVSDEVNHYLSTMACFEGRALRASETLYSMDAAAEAPCMGLRRVYEARKALPHQVQQIPRTKKALK